MGLCRELTGTAHPLQFQVEGGWRPLAPGRRRRRRRRPRPPNTASCANSTHQIKPHQRILLKRRKQTSACRESAVHNMSAPDHVKRTLHSSSRGMLSEVLPEEMRHAAYQKRTLRLSCWQRQRGTRIRRYASPYCVESRTTDGHVPRLLP